MRTAELAALCDSIAWDDPIGALDLGASVFRRCSDPGVLRFLLNNVPETPSLLGQCERFNIFSKIVLLEGAGKSWKLRLHVFGEPALEAHHHRASFCAQVLAGSYKHLLFGANGVLDPSRLSPPLKPLFAQEQNPGQCYMIDYEMVHSTIAAPGTVSLMLQGPAAVESFDIYELSSGARRVRYGADLKNEVQEHGEKRIDAASVRSLIAELEDAGLLA